MTKPATQPEITERSESDDPVDISITAGPRDALHEVKEEKEYDALSDDEIRDLLQRIWMVIEHRLTIDGSDDIGVSISVEDQP